MPRPKVVISMNSDFFMPGAVCVEEPELSEGTGGSATGIGGLGTNSCFFTVCVGCCEVVGRDMDGTAEGAVGVIGKGV